MHPITLIYKFKRRLRRYGERLLPWLFFHYGDCFENIDEFFVAFHNIMPFTGERKIKDRISESDKAQLIAKADTVCRHEFDLLGSGLYCFEGEIDWHIDFKSGYRWSEKKRSSGIPLVSGLGSDIKVPWELSRFNHAVTLGLAWHVSGDVKYVDEFIAQVRSWISNNTVGYGVNWICAMDVAIRAVNWLVAFGLLFDVLMTDEFKSFRRDISRVLWQHANFISTHLEWYGPKANVGGNHFVSDLAGLYSLGLFFRETAKGRNWVRFSHQRIEAEMRRQVLSDGTHFECSPAYHRLVLEMFMWCGTLAENSDNEFSEGYYVGLERMQNFVFDYIKPDGTAPLIGDNDDGRFITSTLLSVANHGYVLPSAENGDGIFCVDRFLLDGNEIIETEPPQRSAAYSASGFYFLRNENSCVSIRAGRLAHAGGHTHNDQLSFELRLKDMDVVVDCGSYVYTSDPDARNRFRSTAAHNVVAVNDAEQNRMGDNLFSMQNDTDTHVVEQGETILDASHRGFYALKRIDFEHRRKFRLETYHLEIEDSLAGLIAKDKLSWFVHLAPGLDAEVSGQRISVLKNGEAVCSLDVLRNTTAKVEEYCYSPSYGVLKRAKVILIEYVVKNHEDRCKNIIKLCWE